SPNGRNSPMLALLGKWVRVLANECIKRLCPVYFHSNGSEYIMALTTGKHEGYVHFGTITDGHVSFEMLPRHWSVCQKLAVNPCFIIWAVFISDESTILLLVESEVTPIKKLHHVVSYSLATDDLEIIYVLPEFIPDARGLECLTILGTESYTSVPMVPRGMFFNPYNNLLFIWGNFLLQSYNMENFMYLADFPKELTIKYLVNSFQGEMAIVTENEEIWYLLEGSYQVHRLFPSKSWEIHISLQAMHQSSLYSSNETMVTLFYEDSKLYQLVYFPDEQRGRLVKRLVPVERLLMYKQHSKPLTVPGVGFVQPYADPVHDPTWRWWKNKKQDQDYYFYLASNGLSAGGVHIDMDSYEKIYNLKPEYKLPERIFLDKGNSYRFSIFLTARGHGFKTMQSVGVAFRLHSRLQVGMVLADPGCLEVVVAREILINRNSVLFSITLKDKMVCYGQGISGHHLLKTSLMVKVVGSSGNCFQNTHLGLRLQGNLMVPVLIGCPPGKRLAFDITYTLKYNRLQNKHYFDCINMDPEMPLFYPFFLIQDLVTGDSGSFQGSFVLKVVGGGPSLDSIRDYSDEEIYRFNSPLDKTNSLIWTTRTTRTTKDSAFHILSHRSSGIEWLCMENSPCHDTIPKRFFAPDFFFKVLVSNRDVDTSTYCDYQLIFLLHVHGLPLSSKRALFIVIVATSLFLGLVLFYIIICLLWPFVVKACNFLRWKINSLIATESYYTYAASSGSCSLRSWTMSREISRAGSKVVEKAGPKQPWEQLHT
uniref:Cation channel sperm associated auxiliary subunit gamma n=1 Tax=Oryctolagus cuniculus TaxID=9986 RepID=A0A5F9D2G9_RABIT